MAFTVTVQDNSKTVFGNKRAMTLKVTADAATDAFATGLNAIDFFTVAPHSMTTAAGKFRMNVLTAATAAPGYMAVTGVANGDVFYITVFGR